MEIIGEFQRKSEKIREFQRKSENFRENRGISEENEGKIGEFPRNSFPEVAEPKGDPAVVSGHFRSFSVVFAVISGENWRISEKNGEYRGNLSVFIPFLSFSFLNP